MASKQASTAGDPLQKKRAAALKRNLLRRKATTVGRDVMRGQQPAPAMSRDSAPHGEDSSPSREQF
jgi:hypothetical protein